MAFPASIDNLNTGRTVGDTGHTAEHNAIAALVNALQTKVGVNGSAVTSSLDFIVGVLSRIQPIYVPGGAPAGDAALVRVPRPRSLFGLRASGGAGGPSAYHASAAQWATAQSANPTDRAALVAALLAVATPLGTMTVATAGTDSAAVGASEALAVGDWLIVVPDPFASGDQWVYEG